MQRLSEQLHLTTAEGEEEGQPDLSSVGCENYSGTMCDNNARKKKLQSAVSQVGASHTPSYEEVKSVLVFLDSEAWESGLWLVCYNQDLTKTFCHYVVSSIYRKSRVVD